MANKRINKVNILDNESIFNEGSDGRESQITQINVSRYINKNDMEQGYQSVCEPKECSKIDEESGENSKIMSPHEV